MWSSRRRWTYPRRRRGLMAWRSSADRRPWYLVLGTWSVHGPLVLRPSGTGRQESDSIVKRTKDLGPGTDQVLSTRRWRPGLFKRHADRGRPIGRQDHSIDVCRKRPREIGIDKLGT